MVRAPVPALVFTDASGQHWTSTEMAAALNGLIALQERIDVLEYALTWARRYGREFNHEPTCMVFAANRDGRPCDCGYDKMASFGSIDCVLRGEKP